MQEAFEAQAMRPDDLPVVPGDEEESSEELQSVGGHLIQHDRGDGDDRSLRGDGMSEEEAALEDERKPEQMVRLGISAQMAERLAIGAPVVRGPAISADTAEKLGLTVQAAERLAASADRPQSGKGGIGVAKGEVKVTPLWPTAATSSMARSMLGGLDHEGVPMPPRSWLDKDRHRDLEHQPPRKEHRSGEHKRTGRGHRDADGGSGDLQRALEAQVVEELRRQNEELR